MVMISKTATSLCALAACAALAAAAPAARAQIGAPAPSYDIPPPPATVAPAPGQPLTYTPVAPPAPQAMIGSPNEIPAMPTGNEWNVRAAHQNVRESQWYDHLVEANPGFRAYRMRKECGPITDPQLQADCLATFQQFEPAGRMYGSSMPPVRYRTGAGE
jgi:hypothetical protein